jgi:hypothetical protein
MQFNYNQPEAFFSDTIYVLLRTNLAFNLIVLRWKVFCRFRLTIFNRVCPTLALPKGEGTGTDERLTYIEFAKNASTALKGRNIIAQGETLCTLNN